MDSNNQLTDELIAGYDLCHDYAQLSYFNYKQAEPKTISTTAGEENFQIPVVLFKPLGRDKWLWGEEAQRAAAKEEGTLADDLLLRCQNREETEIEGVSYEAWQLLEIFIRKTLNLLVYEGAAGKIPGIMVVTLDEITGELAEAVKKACRAAGIPGERIHIQDHLESFIEYTMKQRKELWAYGVELLEYKGGTMKAHELTVRANMTPAVADIVSETFYEIRSVEEMFVTDDQDTRNKKLDGLVRDRISEFFGKKMISCVFLTGEEFEKEWPRETLRYLCSGRRVFQGKNLFTKGACYKGAALLASPDKQWIYLGEHKLKVNIGMDLVKSGHSAYHSLISAGENWYDAAAECELILDNESSIELKLIPLENKDKDTRIIIMNLHHLPKRPNRTIRVLLKVSFSSPKDGIITVSDMGFGEFYESSGRIWEHKIRL